MPHSSRERLRGLLSPFGSGFDRNAEATSLFSSLVLFRMLAIRRRYGWYVFSHKISF